MLSTEADLLSGNPESAMRVQEAIGSRSSAIHKDYRASLRPSKVPEPRYPSLKVVVLDHHPFQKACANYLTLELTRPQGNTRAWRRCAAVTHEFRKQIFHHKRPSHQKSQCRELISANDPSAGSPTETLLRLLLPLSDKVHETFQHNVQKLSTASVRIIHRITQSVGATGGVYKGQGRNQHELMTRAY